MKFSKENGSPLSANAEESHPPHGHVTASAVVSWKSRIGDTSPFACVEGIDDEAISNAVLRGDATFLALSWPLVIQEAEVGLRHVSEPLLLRLLNGVRGGSCGLRPTGTFDMTKATP